MESVERWDRACAQETQAGHLVVLLADVLNDRGIDGDALLRRVGLERSFLHRPGVRIPLRQVNRLWQLASRGCDDESLAIDVALRFRPSELQVLYFGLYASQTLSDATARLVRSAHLLDEVPRYRSELHEHYHFIVELSAAAMSMPRQLAAHAVLLSIWRSLSRPDLVPTQLSLNGFCAPRSAAARQRIDTYFGCPVKYEAPLSCMSLTRAEALAPLPGGNAELARFGDEIVERFLLVNAGSAADESQVDAILRQFSAGVYDQEQVAQRLGVSVRTLQRRLAAEGQTFKELLNSARRSLAERLMTEQLSVKAVAYQLGFTDLSNFSRTFRGWFGVAPSEYQSLLHSRA